MKIKTKTNVSICTLKFASPTKSLITKNLKKCDRIIDMVFRFLKSENRQSFIIKKYTQNKIKLPTPTLLIVIRLFWSPFFLVSTKSKIV